jgi:hypothetical protein
MVVNRVKSVVTARFVATVVLSVLMMAKCAPGLVRELNPIKDIVTVTGSHLPMLAGGIGHCVAGAVVWGGIYAWFEPNLLDPNLVTGLHFAAIASLQHPIYDGVLGTVYADQSGGAAVADSWPT